MTHLGSKYLYNIKYFHFIATQLWKHSLLQQLERQPPRARQGSLIQTIYISDAVPATNLDHSLLQLTYEISRPGEDLHCQEFVSSELFQGNGFEEMCWVSGFRWSQQHRQDVTKGHFYEACRRN